MKKTSKKPYSGKEMDEKLVKTLKSWLVVEDDSIKMAKSVSSKTENPFVKMIMDIIAHDSALHKKVQQFIIDSLDKKAISLQPEELEVIWDLIEKHIKLEKKTIELAEEAKGETRLYVQRYLLNYLLEDERKHNALLERLEEIKMRMYPYS